MIRPTLELLTQRKATGPMTTAGTSKGSGYSCIVGHNVRAGLTPQRRHGFFEMRDDHTLAAALQEPQRRVDFWAHASRREMSVIVKCSQFLRGNLIDLSLIRSAEIDRNLRNGGQNYQQLNSEDIGHVGRREILVDDRLHARAHTI